MIYYILAFVFFVKLLYMAFRFKSHKDRGVDEAIDYVEYHPPGDLDMFSLGYMLDGKLNNRDLVATAISLHRKGLLEMNFLGNNIFSYDYEFFRENFDENIFDKEIYRRIIHKELFGNKYIFNLNTTEKELIKISKKIEVDLCQRGYLKKSFIFKKSLAIPFFVFNLFCYIGFVVFNPLGLDFSDLIKALYLFLAICILLFKQHTYFSDKGLDLRRRLRGFKRYLNEVEKDQILGKIKNLDSAEEKIEQIKKIEYFVLLGLISPRDIF